VMNMSLELAAPAEPCVKGLGFSLATVIRNSY
jgi:hypothetical protein